MAPVLSIAAPLQQGSTGPLVRLGREYPFNLWSAAPVVAIDGQYGPGTAAAVRQFQRGLGLQDTGECDQATFALLVKPMADAIGTPLARPTLAETVVAVAQTHLKSKPREVGSNNSGPWCRLYTRDAVDGFESWCAAFASSIVGWAAEAQGVASPVTHTLSCDSIGHEAGISGRLRVTARPGDIFLLRQEPRVDRQWHHAGVVVAVGFSTVDTIEGNTNEGGSPDGFGVFARTRSFQGLDFAGVA